MTIFRQISNVKRLENVVPGSTTTYWRYLLSCSTLAWLWQDSGPCHSVLFISTVADLIVVFAACLVWMGHTLHNIENVHVRWFKKVNRKWKTVIVLCVTHVCLAKWRRRRLILERPIDRHAAVLQPPHSSHGFFAVRVPNSKAVNAICVSLSLNAFPIVHLSMLMLRRSQEPASPLVRTLNTFSLSCC